jgi:hypothetical protein
MSNSTTWRKYGGTNNTEIQNTINTTYLSTENFNMQEPFQGTFRINGDISLNDISASSAVFLNDVRVIGSIFSNNLNINDITADGNLYVEKNEFLTQKLYMDVDNTSDYLTRAFMIGNSGKLGVNVERPSYTLDICGNIGQVLSVQSTQADTRNIIAQNVNHKGISVKANNAVSQLQFFNNGIVDSYIQYSHDRTLTIDVSNNTFITSKVSIAGDSHLLNETLIIHGENTEIVLPNIYLNPSAGSGNTLTLVSGNNTSSSFMNIVSPNGNGLMVGGGTYPVDSSRSFGMIGLNNSTPSQVLVSGNNIGKNDTTVGINTYAPRTETYVLDINGPVHIGHGEIKQTLTTDFEVRGVSVYNGSTVFMVGTSSTFPNLDPAATFNYKVARSLDSGRTWSYINLVGDLNGDYVYSFPGMATDGTYSVFTGDLDYYTVDNGNTWRRFNIAPFLDANKFIKDVMINHDLSYTFLITNTIIGYFSNEGIINFDGYIGNVFVGDIYPARFDVSASIQFNSPNRMSPVISDKVFIAGSSGIQNYTVGTRNVSSIQPSGNYKDISIYGNNTIVAVGADVAYSTNTGVNWTKLTRTFSPALNSVYIYDAMSAIAVGDNATILFSVDGFNTWNPVPDLVLNAGGTKATLLRGNFTHIKAVDDATGTYLITTTIKQYSTNPSTFSDGQTYSFYCYLPGIFGRSKVLDICGNVSVDGDVNITETLVVSSQNESTSTNSGALTVAGGAGVGGNLFIGKNVDVSNNVAVRSAVNSTSSSTGAFTVAGGLGVAKNIYVGGNEVITGTATIEGIVFANSVSGSTSTSTGSLQVAGGAGIKGNVYIGGDEVISGEVSILSNSSSASSSTGALRVSGGVGVASNLHVGGNEVVNGILTLNNNSGATSTSTGTLRVIGGAGITGNAYIGGDVVLYGNLDLYSPLNIRNISESTSSSNGAFTVAGGVGIGGNLNIGGNATVLGSSTITQNSTVLGNTSLSGKLDVSGPTVISSTVASNGTSSGALVVSGGVGVGGNIWTGGNQEVAGTVKVNATSASTSISTGAFSVAGGAGIGGNLYVGGNQVISGITYLTNTTDSTSATTGALQIAGGVGIAGNIHASGNVVSNYTSAYAIYASGLVSTPSIQNGGAIGLSSAGVNIVGTNATNSVVISNTGGKINSTSTSTGALQVKGGVGIEDNLTVGGGINAPTFDTGSPNMYIGNDTRGNICIGHFTDTNIVSDILIGGPNDNVKISGTIEYTGDTVYSTDTVINANLTVNDYVSFTNQAASTSTNTGTLTVNGGVGVGGNIWVGGNLVSLHNITGQVLYASAGTAATSSSTGAVIVSGGVGVGGNVWAGGNLFASQNISGQVVYASSTAAATSSSTGAIIVSGGVGVGGNVWAGGNLIASQNISGQVLYANAGTAATSSSTGAVIVRGGVGVGGNVWAAGNLFAGQNISGQVVYASSTAAATSSSTGAVIVSGGVGVGGNVWAAGNLFAGQNISGQVL